MVIMEPEFKEVVKFYALKNAIKYNGKASMKAVTAALFNHYKK